MKKNDRNTPPFNALVAYLFLLLTLFCANTFAADKKSDTETIGDLLQFGLPAIAYSSTFIMDDLKGRNEFYWSFFTNIIATQALKQSVHKNRPDDSDNDAFPSGHTSMAFQAAGFLHQRYGLLYGIPAYVAATYLGWGREKINEHETIDILAGAAIGWASSYFLTTPYENLQFSPIIDKDQLGITASYNW